jgi:uncharacterized protein YjbJ (UPF0337 family)
MADKRKSPEEQRGEGAWDQAKGRAKQAGGAITGNDKTQGKGKADELKGKAKDTIGKARQKVRDNI